MTIADRRGWVMSGKKKSYSFERKWYSVHEFVSKTKAERKNERGKKMLNEEINFYQKQQLHRVHAKLDDSISGAFFI